MGQARSVEHARQVPQPVYRASACHGPGADVCTDPECYAEKCEAHRMAERQKFAKKWDIAELDDVDVEGDPFAFDRLTLQRGWLEWDSPWAKSELATEAWAKNCKPVTDATVGDLLREYLPPQLAFDVKGKPRTVIRTAEARKALQKAGLIAAEKKPKQPVSEPKPVRETKPAKQEADGPYKLYRVAINTEAFPPVEFDAIEGASEESPREQAASAFMDWFDSVDWSKGQQLMDYVVVPDEEADESNQPAPIVCRPVGELKLSVVPGITAEDYDLLVACGLPTLAALESKCEQHLASKRYAAGSEPSVNSQVYSVLRVFSGVFPEADAVRIGDAVIDFLSLKTTPAEVQTSAPAKKKRKAVTA